MKTSSGVTAVQIVYSSHRGSRQIEHLGSAHSGAEVELLRPWRGSAWWPGRVSWIWIWGWRRAHRMGHLWDALADACRMLGFERAAGGDELFAPLVVARIIEPTSKLDSARVLEEAGVEAVSYRILKRGPYSTSGGQG